MHCPFLSPLRGRQAAQPAPLDLPAGPPSRRIRQV